ncbi:MAG: putative protein YqeN [Candidatus Omnitrophica bacterium]|nr:putative protein YqeN [Candidatus Omnitrophota bacterium]
MVSAPPPAGAHLLAGNDPFLIAEKVQELRGRHHGGRNPSKGIDDRDFRCPEEFADFLEWTRTYSFLGGAKFAVLRSVEELDDEDLERLSAYLQDPPKDCTVVLTCLQDKPTKSTLVAELTPHCQARTLSAPYRDKLPAWVADRLRKRGRRAQPGAAEEVVERIGTDLTALDEAAEQLAVYTEGRPEVTPQDVKDLLGRSASADAYELVDLILEARPERVLAAAIGMRRDGARAFEIVARLAGTLERLQRVSALQEAGWPPARIAETLRINAYFRDKTLAQAARLGGRTGEKVRELLLSCDADLKTGRMEEWKAFERFLLEAKSALGAHSPARPGGPARRG